jgi:hypothetical protein
VLPEDSAQFQVRKFDSLLAVQTTCHTVRTPICPRCQPSGWRVIPFRRSSVYSIIRLDDENFRLDFPLCRVVSNCSSLHPSGQHSVFDKALGFLSKTQLWEDRCNCPDDVDYRPGALIHKASIAIQIQTSGRQSSWSGRASIRYGNCVHQISRLDDHPPSLNMGSLYMEITCSGRATVQTIGHHRPDVAHFRKDF